MEVPARTILGATRQSDGIKHPDPSARNGKLAAAGGVLGALGVVSTCCLLPLVLASLGVSGVWVGNMTALTPYKPALVIGTAALLGYGYYCVYWKSTRACAAGEACTRLRSNRLAKIGLWVASILFAAGLAFDSYIEPLLGG